MTAAEHAICASAAAEAAGAEDAPWYPGTSTSQTPRRSPALIEVLTQIAQAHAAAALALVATGQGGES